MLIANFAFYIELCSIAYVFYASISVNSYEKFTALLSKVGGKRETVGVS